MVKNNSWFIELQRVHTEGTYENHKIHPHLNYAKKKNKFKATIPTANATTFTFIYVKRKHEQICYFKCSY